MKLIDKILDHFNHHKKYSHFFVYKWGILAGVLESLLIILATFSFLNLYDIFYNFEVSPDSKLALSLFVLFLVIFLIFTFLIVFGMPFYLSFKKKMLATALTIIFITIVTLFVFLSILIMLLYLI